VPLTAAQKQVFEDWFKQQCASHVCPACTTNGWSVAGLVGLPDITMAAGPVASTPTGGTVQSVLRVCNKCGYTAHFAVDVVLLLLAATAAGS
jgi:hypothetical protein